LFWNRGSGKGRSFAAVPPERCGPDLLKPIVGRGSAFADIDADGDLDVVLTQIAGPPLLLRNDQGLGHHWLRLKLIGTKGNSDAIGAWIKVRVGNQTLSRQVMPTRSYLSQSELPVTFGLGSAIRLDEVTVAWPGGPVEKVRGLKLNALNVVKQP
ncbi:MAG TPA: CRTAC1 family protein, partial [Candidatus Saccharimonadales bacterium]|nr:CRTAC1 family protein [Candidatus Saccharimonadales bacterium]